MFKRARIKLTIWYLLIIMLISLSFSAFIYNSVSVEFERRLNEIERRIQPRQLGLVPPPGRASFFLEDLENAKNEVLLVLIYTNGAILIFAGIAGYFLAGKTLKPIEEAMEDQKRFVADASHELRTPLTALQTAIEVALRDKNPTLKSVKDTLKDNLAEIGGMTTLSNNLLSLTRMQQNHPNFESVNLKSVSEDVIKKLTPMAYAKKIKIKSDLSEIKLRADKESLGKLITILLDNAIKFSPKGKNIEIVCKKQGKCALISVKDEGIGIKASDIPHIFDRFYQADLSRTKTETSGYGLGLSIAKQIIKTHKGKIKVESKMGKGSTFTVRLPLKTHKS